MSLGLSLSLGRPSRAEVRPAAVDERIAAMTPRELAARMFMVPVAGTALSADDAEWLRVVKPGGVVLIADNFGTPEEIAALVADIHATNPDWPPLVALDQEGGLVSRIADDPAPDAPTMGLLPPEEITELAHARSEVLAEYGFDVNFAPVADVAFTPDSFMVDRSFGAEPEAVAEDVTAYLEGVVGTGVLHCVKHFPGHGRVTVDSHEALPVIEVNEATWLETDALPFQAAIATGVPMVMLGHLEAPMWGDLPATLSPDAIEVLRTDLEFSGVVVTDDLNMGALDAWQPLEILDLAIDAGVDLLLYVGLPDTPEALVSHVSQRMEHGDLAADRIAASVERLVRMERGRL